MNGQFKVGEVLVGTGFVIDTDRNGMECTIISSAQIMKTFNVKGNFRSEPVRHMVEWLDGTVTAVKPINLRRKQPPAGEQSILRMFTQPMPQKELA